MTDAILYETPAPHIARIVLNRPDSRNAQDTGLLYALNEAFDRAAQDDSVKVIILAAAGPHFSSGHDLREGGAIADQMAPFDVVGTWCGFGCAGAEGRMAREKEIYLGLSERWRNIPKPTIAQVQGKCISGGLMLAWPCDLITASHDAMFSDNTVGMGVGGVEYFGHPWELGARKAKELLFTAEPIGAEDALRLGMVNHVVPAEELEAFTLDLAQRIARHDPLALRLAKRSVNQALDAQGQAQAIDHAFAIHHLGHTHHRATSGSLIAPPRKNSQT